MVVKTILSLCILCLLVLFAPLWIQLVGFLLACIFMHFRLLLLIPALVGDIVYAPTTAFSLSHYILTLSVIGMLLVWWIVVTRTRVKVLYETQI